MSRHADPTDCRWQRSGGPANRMYGEICETVVEAGEAIRQARQAYVDAGMASAGALSQYMADPARGRAVPGGELIVPAVGGV